MGILRCFQIDLDNPLALYWSEHAVSDRALIDLESELKVRGTYLDLTLELKVVQNISLSWVFNKWLDKCVSKKGEKMVHQSNIWVIRESINQIVQFYIQFLFKIRQEDHGPHRSLEKTVQIIKQIWLYHNVDSENKEKNFMIIYWFFIWTNLNPLHPRMLCAKFG